MYTKMFIHIFDSKYEVKNIEVNIKNKINTYNIRTVVKVKHLKFNVDS